jgi:hypothetical protein
MTFSKNDRRAAPGPGQHLCGVAAGFHPKGGHLVCLISHLMFFYVFYWMQLGCLQHFVYSKFCIFHMFFILYTSVYENAEYIPL